MSLQSAVYRWLSLAMLCALGAGCWEGSENQVNEQKDPYFIKGKSLSTSLDYTGAVDAFEKALEVNPRNASAHFELFFLYKEKLNDYAAAIYHGERFLKLRPNADLAEIVRQHIIACKQELAKTLPVGPVTPSLQRDFERLSAENKRLRQQIELLTQQLTLATNRTVMAPVAPAADTNLVAPASLTRWEAASVAPPARTNRVVTTAKAVSPRSSPTATVPATAKTHVVKSGETLARIARRYGVRLPALQAANPSVDARHLRAGQVLKIPSV